ncbi:phosphatase PAP2 family protein [Amorphoplanes digitatis]|uniref:Membrane-associated phospholipid phosphatase n=1 Tax=Actinoplanes digitatis TaxID=1868 RepID=A0A7W7HRM4_9ACTN|nr:phosphatase PAP2 family protein [Actinoplanes digitatis]MBB4759550.1 membrane-associated phospholipid phosphatase [Actinoplanes digitatis]BFE67424.1 phosphatase PAP2 family protein [Actinoplanes digitatis]GID94947.1 phosphatidic acid phosphatase [Actinoplanes digitatis]
MLMPVRPRGWWFDAALLAGFVALTVALARGHLLALDVQVADWVDAHRPAPLYWMSRVLNYLGQGGQVLMSTSILLAGLVAWRRRSVRPVLVIVVAFLVTFVTIGPLKVWLDRAAPHFAGPDREILFNPAADGPVAMSYPSGHVANALAWYAVIAVLLSALLRSLDRPPLSPRANAALRVLPPVIVFFTTTYLAFHWITDSVAGLLLGLILARVLTRIPWDAIPLPRLPNGIDRPAGLDDPVAAGVRAVRARRLRASRA